MTRRGLLLSGSFAAFVVGGVADVGRAQPGNPTTDDILQVWKARQDKVATARFELKRKETIYKGSNWMSETERAKTGKGASEPDPPRDYEVEGISTVSIDGGKMRYRYDMPVWCPRTKVIRQEHYETAFDGQLFRSLRNPSSGEHPHPTGMIKKLSRSESADLFSLLPLTVTFRGQHEQFIRNLPYYEVTGRIVAIRGRPCLELVAEERARNRREVLHLDKERGYVVVRKTVLVEDKPTWQIDVTYSADPLVGWVPRTWEYVVRVGKERKPSESGQTTVVKYELNGPSQEEEYLIAFPTGTRVFDTSSGAEIQYAIQSDGAKGKEIPLSQKPTYEDLLQPAERGWSAQWTVIVILFAVVAVLSGVLLWRWRHRDKPPPGVTHLAN